MESRFGACFRTFNSIWRHDQNKVLLSNHLYKAITPTWRCISINSARSNYQTQGNPKMISISPLISIFIIIYKVPSAHLNQTPKLHPKPRKWETKSQGKLTTMRNLTLPRRQRTRQRPRQTSRSSPPGLPTTINGTSPCLLSTRHEHSAAIAFL